MSEFRIGETVQVNGVRDGIILKQHSVDLELWKVWFDDLNDWKYMLTSELESTDTLRAEREALAAEVERLAMSQRGILNRALIAETNEATFRKLLIESEYTLKTLPNPSIAATHLRGRITDALKTTQDVKDTK